LHELGIVINVVKTVEDFAQKNGLTKIDTLVLQIGAMSPVIPTFVENCYPIAVKDTLLEDTKLQIEIIPANGRCNDCEHVFNVIQHRATCPNCKADSPEMISGNEFLIKEVVAC